MSPSLQLEVKHEDAPFSDDPVERATWAELRILVEGRCVTEFWNQETGQKEESVYVPLFSIAEWVVQNWWALLYEPCHGDAPPKADVQWNIEDRKWLTRHCIRASDSALVLPYFHIFSNGSKIAAVWDEDLEAGASVRYWTKRSFLLDRESVETALRNFVSKVLAWCGELDDQRVVQLRLDWETVESAGRDEHDFCEAAGRMGLDPYGVRDWPDGLEAFVAGEFGDQISDPISTDFLEATEPSDAVSLWRWIAEVQRQSNLSANAPFWSNSPIFHTAKDCGYHFAREARKCVNLSEADPIDNLTDFARELGGLTFSLEPRNHVPSRNVNALVGWVGDSDARVVGPAPPREDNARFLIARGLYQALNGCAGGARLLTRASTWDQQAGRAFAAELLAPQEALAQSARSDMDFDERKAYLEDAAKRFNVSELLIDRQLQNQGVWS